MIVFMIHDLPFIPELLCRPLLLIMHVHGDSPIENTCINAMIYPVRNVVHLDT